MPRCGAMTESLAMAFEVVKAMLADGLGQGLGAAEAEVEINIGQRVLFGTRIGWSAVSTGAALRLGRGSNGGLCLRRLGLELAAGGVKRPFEHWRAVAAPDVKPGPNHFVASVTDGAGFP